MPRVPQYEGPQVRSAPLQGGFQGDLGTGQVARATQQLGGAIGNLGEAAERMAVRDDADAAFRAETAIKSGWLQFDSELRKRSTGENAKGYVDEVDKWWAKAGEAHREALSPRAQALVSRSLSAMRTQSMASAMNFRETELDRAQTAAWVATKETSISAAAADPSTAAIGRATVLERNAQQAALKGWSREQLDAENLRDTTKLHLNVVNGLLTDNPEAAKAYFDANVNEIDGSTHKNAIKFITDAVEDKQAAARGAEIAALPADKQAEALAGIKDTTLQTKTRKVVREVLQDQQIARQQTEQAASDTIWQMVGVGVPQSRLPKAVLAQMNGRERVQVVDHYEAKRKAALIESRSDTVKTDMATLERLYSMPKDKFLATKISTLADKLSRADQEELIKRQASLRDPKKAVEVATTEQQLNSTLGVLEIKAEDKGAFTKQFYDELNVHLKRTGKEPTYDERQAIIDRLALERDNTFFEFGRKRYFEMTPEERAEAKFRGQTGEDKFTPGQVYRDAKGNRSKYLGNGQWEPVTK